jgi:hypothetical protein
MEGLCHLDYTRYSEEVEEFLVGAIPGVSICQIEISRFICFTCVMLLFETEIVSLIAVAGGQGNVNSDNSRKARAGH